MIGLDYSDIYVADCGQQFASRSAGVAHERECDRCESIARQRSLPDGSDLTSEPQSEE